MGKKFGTDLEVAKKIVDFLEENLGKPYTINFLSEALAVGYHRIKRLLKIAETLKLVDKIEYDKGKRVLYLIPQEHETL